MIKKMSCKYYSAILVALSVLTAFTLSTGGMNFNNPPFSSIDKKQLEKKVDAYVKPYLQTGDFSGSILIAKSGDVLLMKSYGLADRENKILNTPQTKFHLASTSKPFTTAAIMLLEEQGRLKVTDPLTKFIPDYPNGDKITVHHLMIHSTGIANINGFSNYGSLSQHSQTPATLVAQFKNKALIFEPGDRCSYSNSNYNLLAYIIEHVSGKDYGTFLKENIFDPIGMKNSGHDTGDGSQLEQSAKGYATRWSHRCKESTHSELDR